MPPKAYGQPPLILSAAKLKKNLAIWLEPSTWKTIYPPEAMKTSGNSLLFPLLSTQLTSGQNVIGKS
jgi:hypothetical protein